MSNRFKPVLTPEPPAQFRVQVNQIKGTDITELCMSIRLAPEQLEGLIKILLKCQADAVAAVVLSDSEILNQGGQL